MARAGALDRRITIERRTNSQNTFGEPVPTWNVLRVCWAEVRRKSAKERFTADEVNAEADTMFKVRWFAGLKAVDRIRYDGDTYDITGIKELGRREMLEIAAMAEVE